MIYRLEKDDIWKGLVNYIPNGDVMEIILHENKNKELEVIILQQWKQ